MKYILFLGILVSQISLSETAICNSLLADTASITISPGVYQKAFTNPLKGFRSSSTEAEGYPTLTRLYVKWNEIENSENEGVEKILDYCNRQWKDLPRRNVKVIPRVYLEWQYSKQNAAYSRDTVTAIWGDTRYVDRFWPADMKRGDYSSEEFKNRLVNLISKMGQAWDNDSRVAYIEMGLIGWWGEQHTPYINDEMQNLIGDAFTSAFKTKLIMVRQVKDFTSYSFGSYWDSFAHASQQDEVAGLVACGDKWKTTFQSVDIRTWLPGDMWDRTEKKYKIEPEKNQTNGKFLLPADLPNGEYILALSILDPAGNVPAVRFAIKNYFRGGRHPNGKIGINNYIDNPELDNKVFDDLFSDRSLYYEIKY